MSPDSPDCPQGDQPLLLGTKHKDRVLLPTVNHAVSYWSSQGLPATERRSETPQSEFSTLKASLSKDIFQALADLVNLLGSECSSRTCPDTYREFLSELACNSPASGLLQLECDSVAEQAREVLEKISDNIPDVRDSRNSQHLALLQANTPVLAEFICTCPRVSGKLPDDVCGIIRHILTKVQNTYSLAPNSPSSYGTPNPGDSKRSFFPAWPVIWGPAKYNADDNTAAIPRELDECRKASYGHPSLTPILPYTVHMVCATVLK